MATSSEPEPYARYKLKHYGYNVDRTKTGFKHDYEDVKVRSAAAPSLQTTVTFGEGLKSPSELFGSLKKAGQRFVGAEKLVGSFGGLPKIPRNVNSKCQCRHHQKRLLDTSTGHNKHHGSHLSDITESEHNVEGQLITYDNTIESEFL